MQSNYHSLNPGSDDIPESWHYIAQLRPQLQQHVSAYPQDFRGARWYVLSDSARGRHMRFNESAYQFIGRLDGDLTVDEIYRHMVETLGEDAPARQDVLNILTQLFNTEVLRSGLPADVEQLFKRQQAEKQANRVKRFLNPLAVRFPLFDPDNFLNRTQRTVRPLFSLGGVVLWCVVIALATVLLITNYSALIATLQQNIFAPQNIVLMILLFPFMKAVHEFAHAYTVKMWGGEVHEMGITLLVLMPVPYVDASAAWAFREKYKRVLVGAAGMIAELFLAALAFIIWTMVQPGIIKDAALSAFLIGSVSTILFNANPLLRFDGYYILQDIIEIPNLYTRSAKYNLYLLRKILLRDATAVSPVTIENEAHWLMMYGILAWLYRLFITLVIAIFLASKFLVLGVILALWSIVLMFVVPTYKGIRFLLVDNSLDGTRTNAIGRAGALAAVIVAVVSLVPFSLYTHAEGIVWVPDQAQIYAQTDGFVTEISATAGSEVAPGTAVLKLENPDLIARRQVLQAQRRELSERLKTERISNPVEAVQTEEELITVQADLESLLEEISAQTLVSQSQGTLVFPQTQNLIGRYIRKGDPVAYVVDPQSLIVRLVVPQTDIGLFVHRVNNVEVRLAEQPGKTISATMLRETPSGSNILPSRALSVAGGGEIAVASDDEKGTTAIEKVFQLDLKLPLEEKIAGLGTRAFVRINHGREILVQQWLRKAQQLLLNTLPF